MATIKNEDLNYLTNEIKSMITDVVMGDYIPQPNKMVADLRAAIDDAELYGDVVMSCIHFLAEMHVLEDLYDEFVQDKPVTN